MQTVRQAIADAEGEAVRKLYVSGEWVSSDENFMSRLQRSDFFS
jgi:hypothetical protein